MSVSIIDHMIDEPLVPTAEQEAAICKIVAEPTHAALLVAPTGSGKTAVLVTAMLRLGLKRVMVSAPIHTHEGWRRTILRQSGGQAQVFLLNKNTKEGRENWKKLEWGVPGWYLISRELWRLQNWTGIEVDGIAHDECHTLARRGNTGSRLARKVAKGWLKTDWTVCMSATPFGGSFDGAWAIGRILWQDKVDKVFVRFESEYCALAFDPYTRQMSRVIGEKNPGRFVSELPCYVTFKSDAQTAPAEDDIHVALSRTQRKLYDKFEEDGVVWLRDQRAMIADIPVVQRIRLRQLTLGECSINEDNEVDFAEDCKSTKIDMLQSLISDLDGEKLLIVTDSAKFARVTAKRIGGFAWTGAASHKEREAAKQEFIHGDLRFIVATQASIGEGTDGLHLSCHIMVILSKSDSSILNTQCAGRLARKGQTERVVIYNIVGEKTLDDKQATTLLTREISMRQSMFIGI